MFKQIIISIIAAVLAVCAFMASGLSPENAGVDRRSFVKNGVMGALAANIAVLTTSPNLAFATTSSALPAIGERAPDFELPSSRGNGSITSKALLKSNKWTVLFFYPGAFSQGCTLEARAFQKDLEDYRKLNAQIVGVSVDPVEKNAQFCTEEKLDFFMLSDKGGEVSKKYGSDVNIRGVGTLSNRQTYLIDPNGKLRWIFTDVESRVPRHSAEVLEKLAELEKA